MHSSFTKPEQNIPAISEAASRLPNPALRRFRRRARLHRRFYRTMNAAVSGLFCGEVACLLSLGEGEQMDLIYAALLIWLAALGIGLTNISVALSWQRTARELADTLDLQGIGAIIEGLRIDSETDGAQELLTNMLPHLQTSDAHRLDARHRAILNSRLGTRTLFRSKADSTLIRAILTAYEQIGDSKAVPFVERLASGRGYARRDKSVQQAAQECLPFLYANGQNETHRQNLLRASAATPDAPHLLLRSALVTPETDPRLLLRSFPPESERD